MHKVSIIRSVLVASLMTYGASALSGPISISEVVNVNNDTSPGSQISDGLADAFDGYGILSSFGSLTISRQINTLESDFTYRFYEQFTNETTDTVNVTVRFGGNLGSDGSENIARSDDFSHITFQDSNNDGIPDQNSTPSTSCCSNDPVLSFVFGNNTWASNNISIINTSNNFDIDINLSLAAGESTAILFYAGLLLDQDDRAGDVTRGLTLADSIIGAPFTEGLTEQQLNLVTNFDFNEVPAPATLALMGLGLAGLGWKRRKKA